MIARVVPSVDSATGTSPDQRATAEARTSGNLSDFATDRDLSASLVSSA